MDKYFKCPPDGAVFHLFNLENTNHLLTAAIYVDLGLFFSKVQK